MQNNIDNNNDAFNDIFRQKLEHHTAPVDPASWDAIQAGLKAQKRKKILPFWWFSGAAVAVMVLLLTVGNFMQMQNETLVAKLQVIHRTVVLKQNVIVYRAASETKNSNLFVAANTTNNKLHTVDVDKTKTIQNAESIILIENADIALAETKKLDEAKLDVKHEISIDQKADVEPTQAANQVDEAQTAQTLNDNLKVLDVESDWADPFKKDKNNADNNWVLLAAMGSGGGSNSSAGSSAIKADVSTKTSIVRAPTMNTSILTPADFSNRTYMAPLSFGISASKSLNKTISIETGLKYSYLSTAFVNARNDAELSLHYLGVPLNLIAQIWKSQKWGVYGSTGMTFEKGLQSIYVQNQYVGTQTITTTASTKITGLQLSASAAVGATYNVYRDFDVYFEPKLSYYFDNNQPISIRTDKNLIVDVEAGVRFNF